MQGSEENNTKFTDLEQICSDFGATYGTDWRKPQHLVNGLIKAAAVNKENKLNENKKTILIIDEISPMSRKEVRASSTMNFSRIVQSSVLYVHTQGQISILNISRMVRL